jgi:hypothetical protein
MTEMVAEKPVDETYFQLPHALVAVIGMVVTYLLAFPFASDSFAYPGGAAVVGGVAAAALSALFARRLAGRVKNGWVVQVVLAVIVAMPLVLFVRSERDRLFEKALALELPAGVGRLHIWKDSDPAVAGSGLILYFHASSDAIEEITGARPYELRINQHYKPTREFFAGAWQATFPRPTRFQTTGWRTSDTFQQPKLWKWKTDGIVREQAHILWDEATGRTYAMYWQE